MHIQLGEVLESSKKRTEDRSWRILCICEANSQDTREGGREELGAENVRRVIVNKQVDGTLI